VLRELVTPEVLQFIGKKFIKFCDDYHIRVDWTVVAHPRCRVKMAD
jgi:hypothetical protein